MSPEAERRAFIVEHTALGRSKLAPGIKLYLASKITPLWHASEVFLENP